MKSTRLKLVLGALILLLAGAMSGLYYYRQFAGGTVVALKGDEAERANAFVDLVEQGKVDEAHQRLNDLAREKIPKDKLGEVWTTLNKQMGGAPTRGETRAEIVQGHRIVIIPLKYPMMNLDCRIGFDPDGRLNTFRLVPALSQAPAVPPSFVDNDTYAERAVKLGPAGRELDGTLSLPKGAGPFPAVVLVHGSGPQDRDETIGKTRPFADLAAALASQGIAVLRYEKRSKARPQEFADNRYTVDLETVDDALAGAELLRHEATIDPARVIVVGHSLGAMMAPRIASRDPRLAGVAMLAAPSRALQAVYLEQIDYLANLDGKVDADEQKQLDQEKAKVARLTSTGPSGKPEENPLNLAASYWADLLGYDQVKVAQALTLPMFIAQGGRDYQVTKVDFDGWQQALAGRDTVTFRFYPKVSHVFIAGEGMATPDEYLTVPGHVDAAPIADLVAWITALKPPATPAK